MQIIRTKYRGAGNTHGSKIIATTSSGIRKIVPYDHSIDADLNHVQAAQALAQMLNEKSGGTGWNGQWHGGHDEKGGMVFVCAGGWQQFGIGGGA